MNDTPCQPTGAPPGARYAEPPVETLAPSPANQAVGAIETMDATAGVAGVVVTRRPTTCDPISASSTSGAAIFPPRASEPQFVLSLPSELTLNLMRRLDLPTLARLGRSCKQLGQKVSACLESAPTPGQLRQRRQLHHRDHVRQLDLSRRLFGSSWSNCDKIPDRRQAEALLQMVNTHDWLCIPLLDENSEVWQDMVLMAASGTATVLVLEFSSNAMFNDCSGLLAMLKNIAGKQAGREVRLRCSFEEFDIRGSKVLADFLVAAPALSSLWLEVGSYFAPALSALGETIAASTLRDFRCHTRKHSDQIGSVIFNALAATQLQHYHLSETALMAHHASDLADALRENSSLTDLHLGYSHFSGENYVALALVLVQLTALRRLGISHNAMDSKAMVALAPLLAQSTCLTSLQLDHVWIDDAAGTALGGALASSTTLTHLQLTHNSISPSRPWTAAGCLPLFQALLENRSLLSFEMSPSGQCAENGAVLGEVLRRNTVLEELQLHDLHFSDDDEAEQFLSLLLSGLAQNASLRKLGLTTLPQIPWRALEHMFSANVTLGFLDFSFNIRSAHTMQQLLMALRGNSSLYALKLSGGRPALVESDLTVDVAPLCTLIATSSGLRRLDLSACGIAGGSAQLADALAANRTLAVLDLSGNPFDQAGLPALLSAIASHPTLQEVRLKRLRLSMPALHALAEALGQRRHALRLEIDACHFSHGILLPRAHGNLGPVSHNDILVTRALLIARVAANPGLLIPGLLSWMPAMKSRTQWEAPE